LMSDSQFPEDSFVNSIIGEGTRFNGEFDLNGLLRIDGDFCGTVRTKGKVLVGKNGRAECVIYAGTVVIGGIVRGNIFAVEKVVILSTGVVLGNISTPRLIVEEGVIFNGQCKIIESKSSRPDKASQPETSAQAPRVLEQVSAAATAPAREQKKPVAAPD